MANLIPGKFYQIDGGIILPYLGKVCPCHYLFLEPKRFYEGSKWSPYWDNRLFPLYIAQCVKMQWAPIYMGRNCQFDIVPNLEL